MIWEQDLVVPGKGIRDALRTLLLIFNNLREGGKVFVKGMRYGQTTGKNISRQI